MDENLLQQTENTLCEHNLLTACEQTCYKLCVFTRVTLSNQHHKLDYSWPSCAALSNLTKPTHRHTRQGGGELALPPKKSRKERKFGKTLGKINKIRENISENMLK